MANENIKNYGAVLMVASVVIVLGLLMHWRFATWQVVDWILVVVLGYIGYKIYIHSNK